MFRAMTNSLPRQPGAIGAIRLSAAAFGYDRDVDPFRSSLCPRFVPCPHRPAGSGSLSASRSRSLPWPPAARATAYMARAAGGDWPDPDADMLAEIEEEIAERLESLKREK
jgi:hypothetical protein